MWTVAKAASHLRTAGKSVKHGKLRRVPEESPHEYTVRAVGVLRAGATLAGQGSKSALWAAIGLRARTMMSGYLGGQPSPVCARALIEAGAVDVCPCGDVRCEGCQK